MTLTFNMPLVGCACLALVVAMTKADQAAATDPPATRTAEAADDAELILKVLDPEGQPVADAKVGPYIQWRTGKIDEPTVYGFGESGAANETDADGVVSISKAALKDRMYDDKLAICALSKDNKLIGLITVSEEDLGATKEIQLQPAISLEMTIKSAELEQLGRKLEGRACYLYVGDERPFFSLSRDGDSISFLLPPGKYKYDVYGSKLVGAIDGEIELSADEPNAAIEFDLPASNLGRLIGQPAPELDGVAHWKNSEPLMLADLRGKVVVLEFWGHWCGPCVYSMPELVKLYEEFKDKGLEVIAVHDDSVESVADLEEKTAGVKAELWDNKDLPFPIAIDGKGTEKMPNSERTFGGQTVGKYGIRSWPTAILIDREGQVVDEFQYRSPEGRKTLLVALGLEDDSALEASGNSPAPPESEKRPGADTYHGTEVAENYRWLEDWNDAEVKAWSKAQNAYARAILDNLPGRAAIEARVSEIMSAETTAYWAVAPRGDKFFALKAQPPKQQPFLVMLDSLDDTSGERVLVDPNALDPTGGTSLTWYKPSFDGKLIAVCLSHGGDEVGDVTVYDVATGRPLEGEMIPRVNTGTAGGDLAWTPDGSGFFYTRHPREGERPAEDMNFYQQVYFHKLGTPTAEDRYELGEDSPRIAETELKTDRRTGRVLATIQNGDGGEFAHYLREVDGAWRQFSKFEDKIIQAEFGPKDDLYVVSLVDAPRGKIVHVPIDKLDVAAAEVVVPEGEDTIVTSFWQFRESSILATDARLYVVYQLGGPSEVRVFDLKGMKLTAPEQLDVASVGHLTPLEGDDILFEMGSYIRPPAVYRYDAESSEVTETALKSTEPVNLDDAEVVRAFATSKDGTRVPINIIYRKGTERNGRNPCLVTAYGGYGVSIPPGFRALNRVLLDHGFVVATANVRGGGEYGEEWHRQGNLTNKQNVFDDFAAALEFLVDEHYTSSPKLAIIGGSNGGLLMGATLTQHPDLMRCVVASVGIYDMLRVELSPNGAFNVTEFGTVKNPEHFQALRAYSPYHNVKDGVRYPAVLFLTGANDPRVDPMQSRKMTARLQAADPEGTFLLRTSDDSGHGGDTPLSERIAQQTDIFAFIFAKLGVPFGE